MITFSRILFGQFVLVLSLRNSVPFSTAFFVPTTTTRQSPVRRTPSLTAITGNDDNDDSMKTITTTTSSRRHLLQQATTTGAATAAVLMGALSPPLPALAAVVERSDKIDTPKFVQQYEDFAETPEGWSYRDTTPGNPDAPKAEIGDRVVFDWSGYTIGYFGRPFQAKGGPQGGAFDKDIDYARTVIGSGKMVKGLECALVGMQQGGVRQIVVPFGDFSYPMDDLEHNRVGPKPSTFSGQRALNFVLENQRIDRTLLFNVKVIRVDKPDGKGGFQRG